MLAKKTLDLSKFGLKKDQPDFISFDESRRHAGRPDLGTTFISIVTVDGIMYAVDQEGKRLPDYTSLSAAVSAHGVQVITLTILARHKDSRENICKAAE